MLPSRSTRRYKKILKSDPDICLVQTPAGLARVMKYHFRELIHLEPFARVGDRVAKVRDGWAVTWDNVGFHAYRLDRRSPGPSIFTNAQLIERHAIYDVRGRSLSLEERQREGAAAYGMAIHFGEVR